MEKIYFGICNYCDEPGVYLVSADKFDKNGEMNGEILSKEVCSAMCSLHIEYVDEGLFGFYDGDPEDLKEGLEKLGFIHNEEVEKEAIASFNDS
jgi:hypothetical protein